MTFTKTFKYSLFVTFASINSIAIGKGSIASIAPLVLLIADNISGIDVEASTVILPASYVDINVCQLSDE